jgi:ATP-binding cassette, subfamily C, bacterial exporter for protease/lipase
MMALLDGGVRSDASSLKLVSQGGTAARPAVSRDEFAQALSACLPLFWTAAAFGAAVNLLFLASPLFLLQLYNRVIPSGSLATLVLLSLFLLVALVAMAVLDAVRARVLVRAAARLDRLLSPRLFQAMIDRPLRMGQGVRTAEPLRDLDTFRGAMAGAAAQLFFDAPFAPLFLLVLFLLHPLLGAIGLVGALGLVGLGFVNDSLTRDATSQMKTQAARGYASADTLVRNAGPIHAMGMARALQACWRRDRDALMLEQGVAADRAADVAALIRFIRLGLQSALLAVGAVLVIRGDMLPASIFASSLLLGRIMAPLEQVVVGWRQMALALAAGRNVQQALNSAQPTAPALRVAPMDAGVSLNRVGFTPAGSPRPILDDVSLSIASGETVGIVGASGAGKSTLARLIAVAALPTRGRVSIGCVPTDKWSSRDLARSVGYLPQSISLFPGTIRENIARFSDCDDKSVLTAASRAGAHGMIMSLPGGYETRLGEAGVTLSGGQLQRIGLARALFGSPRLVVLDEPDTHLDAEGEGALRAALEGLKASGCTVVLVAQRLAPLALVDRMVLLKNGRLQMDGSRAAVLAKLPTATVEHVMTGAL